MFVRKAYRASSYEQNKFVFFINGASGQIKKNPKQSKELFDGCWYEYERKLLIKILLKSMVTFSGALVLNNSWTWNQTYFMLGWNCGSRDKVNIFHLLNHLFLDFREWLQWLVHYGHVRLATMHLCVRHVQLCHSDCWCLLLHWYVWQKNQLLQPTRNRVKGHESIAETGSQVELQESGLVFFFRLGVL